MSTSVEQQVPQNYVNFDEYIDFQLQKTRSSVKLTDLLTAMAGVGTLVLGYLLLFVVFDHWIIPGGFSFFSRLLMLGLLAAVAVTWLTWRIVFPYLKTVQRLFVANLIEQTQPELKGSLLNLVDLQNAHRPVPEGIRTALEKRAAVTLSHMNVDEAIDRRPLMRITYALLVIVVICSLYTVFSPKKPSSSVWRALFPTSSVSVATQTEIVDVRPGSLTVLAGEQVEVIADLNGDLPEKVVLYYTTADRRFVDEPIVMRKTDENGKSFRTVLNGENGRGVFQEMTYYILAGDADTRNFRTWRRDDDVFYFISGSAEWRREGGKEEQVSRKADNSVYRGPFQIAVQQPPSAVVREVRYEFPAYMHLEPRTQTVGHIDAWEGTKVTVTARANMPVKSAIMRFSDTEQTAVKAEEKRMVITNGIDLTAERKLAFRSDGTYPRFYRIQCRNERNETDPDPALYSITIRPDQPPEIDLLDPNRDLELPANSVVPLLFQAHDPDFLLRYITLRIERDGELIHSEPIFDGHEQSYGGTFEFQLETLKLQPGQAITFWLEARDNRQPNANRSNTPKLRIRIIEPVSKEEVQQQLDADRERQQDLLETAKQDRNEDRDPNSEPQSESNTDSKDPGQSKSGEKQQGEGKQPSDEPMDSKDSSEGGKQSPDGSGSGNQSQSKDGDSKQQRRLSPDGQDDEDVLRKLIEREQQNGNKPSNDGQQKDNSNDDQQPQQNGEKENGEKKSPDGQKQTDGGSQEKQPQGANTPAKNDPSDPSAPEKGSEPKKDGSQAADSKDKPKKDGSKDGQQGKPDNKDSESGSQDGGGENKPSDGADPAQKKDSGNGKKQPESPDGGGKKPKENINGEERPAEDSKDARQKKADGDETGKGTAVENPKDPTQAKNKIEPKDGEQPKTQKHDGGGNPQERKKGNGDSGKSGSKKPQQKDQPENPDKRPGQSKDKKPDQPASKRDGQADRGNDDLKGKGRPQGQKSKKPQGGENGSSKQNDRGTPGSKKPGAGDNTKKTGENGPSKKPNGGKSDNKPGEGSKSKPGQKPGAGNKPGGKNGKQSGGKQSGGKKPGGKSSGSKSGSKPGQPTDNRNGQSTGNGINAKKEGHQEGKRGVAKGGPQGKRDGGGDGQFQTTEETEKANLEYGKKAANLVLKRLDEKLQRGEVDQELLKELGWNQDDMKKFAARVRNQLNNDSPSETPESLARHRQFEEVLKNLNLAKSSRSRSGKNVTRNVPNSGFDARRLAVPPEYEEAYKAFTRSLAKKKSRGR